MAITVETALDRRVITAIIASSLGFSLDLFDLFILLYVAEHIFQQAALGFDLRSSRRRSRAGRPALGERPSCEGVGRSGGATLARTPARCSPEKSSPNGHRQPHERMTRRALKAPTYIPDGILEDAPLMVVLHGCLQTAAGYDHGSGWSSLADKEGFALLYPSSSAPIIPICVSTGFCLVTPGAGGGEALEVFALWVCTNPTRGV